MTTFHVTMPCGTEKDDFETKPQAEDGAQTHTELCQSCNDPDAAFIDPVDVEADGGPTVVSDVPPEVHEQESSDPEPGTYDVPEEKPAVDEDPVSWLPDHFIDNIQGTPTVNRMGYAVIAAQYGVSVRADPVTLPSETEFEFAEFKAVATTADGEEYTGFGSAHVERQDGDDPFLLAELAETRAMKRATAWATGVGMTAASELMNDL